MTDPSSYLGVVSRRKMIALSSIAGLGAATSLASSSAAAIAASRSANDRSADARASTDLPWPERGSFGGKAIVGPHQASAAAMIDPRPIFGLPRERTFFYGNLRDAEGNLYEIVRAIAAPGVGGFDGLLVQSSIGKDGLHIMPQLTAGGVKSTGSTADLEGGNAVWTSAPDAVGKPFRMAMSADGNNSRWFEKDLMDLTGTLLGPGLQWHIPDPAGSELYVSQIFEMKGVLLGKPVRGMMGFDQSYLPQGMLMYGGEDPLFRKDMHHRAWFTWATRYTDGSFDAGHFVLGTDRIGFALLTNERSELTLATEVSGTVKLVASGIWPERIDLKVNGVAWEFLPDPKGRMPDMLGGGAQSPTPQIEGRWRRVGDGRKPETWFAWGEVASDGRIAYSQTHRS
jgi:hypothetical protein